MADDSPTEEDDELEKKHFTRILKAFKYYRVHSLRRIADAEKSYSTMQDHQKELVPGFLKNLEKLQLCVDHNYKIIKLIIEDAEYMFENMTSDIIPDIEVKQIPPTQMDMDKVKTTLKQFVRDWSEEGKLERTACYDPVIQEIKQRFPEDICKSSSVKILVPGAGLGRLAFELARNGYTCQGNEWSLFMLMSSNFVLNKCKDVNCYTLYPWVHQWVNHKETADQSHPIRFPDIDPTDLPENSNFTMTAGDFLEVYNEPETWDCVATVFFIDTAHNIISYIEKIWSILQPGGFWVNLGPLLYHYADMTNEISIELSYEDVKKVITKIGFQFEETCLMNSELSNFAINQSDREEITPDIDSVKKLLSSNRGPNVPEMATGQLQTIFGKKNLQVAIMDQICRRWQLVKCRLFLKKTTSR